MGNLNYKIVDNFLEKENFDKFQKDILSDQIPWFYKESQTNESLNDPKDVGYFSLCLYSEFMNGYMGLNEHLFKMYEKLQCKALIQTRANLVLKQFGQQNFNYHVDLSPRQDSPHITAIYYMNTNNGYTILDKNEKVKIDSVENRMLIFDSRIHHCGIIQTDVKRRIVININYY